jgi:hypothetical protein
MTRSFICPKCFRSCAQPDGHSMPCRRDQTPMILTAVGLALILIVWAIA